MAGTTTRRRSTAASATTNNADTAEATTKVEEKQKPIIPKEVDPDQYVTVRNGFQGRLVYKSPSTGEVYVWNEFGSEQEMDLRELKRAKNTLKKFFINNWFMFDEDWIVDYLGVGRYYKNAISVDHFDDIFKQNPAALKKTLKDMSDGQKKSVAYRAKELIADGEIDSLNVIHTLENSLGIELIEK